MQSEAPFVACTSDLAFALRASDWLLCLGCSCRSVLDTHILSETQLGKSQEILVPRFVARHGQ